MRAVIRERWVLEGLQSASGLERLGDFFFVIGDDSPNLVRYDAAWRAAGTTPLFASDARNGDRIAKAAKPDLEAMCCVEWRGRRELLCFGSGSKTPARDVGYRVDVTNPASPGDVRAVSLKPLYDVLRANAAIVGDGTLNVEAATATREVVSLLQRGNISGIHAGMEFPVDAMMQYLEGSVREPPLPRIRTFDLPRIGNRRAGFSAATTLSDGLLIAASVEDTDNAIDDGATLGSFIGFITGDRLAWVCPVEQNDSVAPVKIEGITLLQQDATRWEICAVTDNDGETSEVLTLAVE